MKWTAIVKATRKGKKCTILFYKKGSPRKTSQQGLFVLHIFIK